MFHLLHGGFEIEEPELLEPLDKTVSYGEEPEPLIQDDSDYTDDDESEQNINEIGIEYSKLPTYVQAVFEDVEVSEEEPRAPFVFDDIAIPSIKTTGVKEVSYKPDLNVTRNTSIKKMDFQEQLKTLASKYSRQSKKPSKTPFPKSILKKRTLPPSMSGDDISTKKSKKSVIIYSPKTKKDLEKKLKDIERKYKDHMKSYKKEFGIKDLKGLEVNGNLSSKEKEEIVKQITKDAEYLKNTLEKLPVEKQIEMMLEIYVLKDMNNPELLQKIRENHCYLESILYKILTKIGVSDETARSFSKKYIKLKSKGILKTSFKALEGTYDFLRGWLGLLAILVFEWIAYLFLSKGLILLSKFLRTYSTIFESIFSWAGLTLNVFSFAVEWGTWIPSLMVPLLGKITNIVLYITTTMFGWTKFIYNDLAGAVYVTAANIISFWVFTLTAGVAVFIWAYYLISSIVKEHDVILEFCAQEMKAEMQNEVQRVEPVD